MRGNEIIVSAFPQGKFMEGTITDTSKPGTCMEIVPNSTMQGGRFQYRASSKTTGATREIIVLLPDPMQGGLPTAAYVANTRCFMYVPIVGEQMNVLTAAEPGTGSADAFHIGDLLGVNSSGLSVPNSAYTSTPWTVQEHIVQSPADTPTLVWVERS